MIIKINNNSNNLTHLEVDRLVFALHSYWIQTVTAEGELYDLSDR